MLTFRIVKIVEATSMDEALKIEKKVKPVKIEELEDEGHEYPIGYGRGK